MADKATIVDVQMPPSADTPSRTSLVNAPGTPDGRMIAEHTAQQKRTLEQAWTDGVMNSVGSKMVRNIQQRVTPDAPFAQQAVEGLMAITGQAGRWGESTWDKASNFDALTKDLPREYWEDVMEQDSLEGAQISRQNIQTELRRLQRMGLDKGAAAIVQMAGGLVDIDAPLVVASGGLIGGAKVAGQAAYIAGKAGLKSTTALRVGGAAAGLSGGAQAGALIGVGEVANSDVSTWVDAAVITLTGAVLGTTIGGIAPEAMLPLDNLRKDTVKRISEGDPYFFDPAGPSLTDEVPAVKVTDVRDTPMVMDVQTGGLDGEIAAPGEAFDLPEFNPNANVQSLSAAFSGPSPSPFPALKDPVSPMSDKTKQIISASRNYIWSTNFDTKIKTALNDTWVRASNFGLFSFATGDVKALWTSKSSVLNRMAAAVFEIPSGAVRGEVSNAAILKHAYEKRIMRHTDNVQGLMNDWARDHGHAWIKVPGTNKVVGTRKAGQQEFYRQVMLDMNAVAMGRARNADPRVRAAADAYGAATQESLAIMKGRTNEIPLAGAENVADKSHFMPYRANGGKMAKLLSDGRIDKPGLYEAYKNSYLSAGTFSDPALAYRVAKAYVDRFTARGIQLDDSMLGLFSQDGREFLEASLRSTGLTEQEIAGFMKKFDTDAAERGKIGTLKNRNDLDLETPIGNTGLIIADIMQSDFDSIVATYARQVAGNSALARHGITSRSSRKEWIEAAMSEQRALGETPLDPQVLDAMFSEFDGGPQVGYDRLSGQNRGIGVVSEAKSLTSLALLTFNGFAQLAETGVGIISVGAKNWHNRGIGKLVDKAMRDKNKAAIDELAHYMGAIGQDHTVLRMHLNLDDAAEFAMGNEATKNFLVRGREFLNQANYIQGYTSLVNTVRSFQQEVAVLGMMDKISRLIADDNMEMFQLGGRIQRDTGLDVDHFMRLKDLIDDGTIVFKTDKTLLGDVTYVDRLNLHLWPEDLAQDFASALGRAESQIVQQALAGETSRWMHTVWGASLTHLQTFPLLAIQKQFFRNAMSRDGQAVALALAAYGSAYAALSIRDAITGTDRDAVERARTAFGYSNITGWMPMYSDPIMSVLGLEDLRVNSFGPYARPFSVPIVDTFNNLYRAPGAAVRAMQGEDDWTDRQALRSVPFFRLVESGVRIGSFGNVELLTNPRANSFAREATQVPKSTPTEPTVPSDPPVVQEVQQALQN